jgi:hypothetical protein
MKKKINAGFLGETSGRFSHFKMLDGAECFLLTSEPFSQYL